MNESATRHRVIYTETMVKDAVRVFVWRRVVVAEKALWAVAAILLAVLVWQLWRGERGWLVGVLGAAVLLPPLLYGLVWRAHHRNTVARFRAMPVPEAVLVFADDALGIESGLGTAQIPWSGIGEFWERPGYWMLFTGAAQFFTLPVADLSQDDLVWLRERLQAGRAA